MRESIYFKFDEKHSKDFGVFIGSTDTGLFSETFLPTRSIIETKTIGREKPYLQRVENEPLSFSLSFVLEEWDDRDYLRKVARWLFQDSYKPLVFDSNPSRIFYAIVEGDSSLLHNGAKEGYVELKIRCDSPYTYSPEYIENNIKYRDNNIEKLISNDISNFDNGTHTNTVVTANGLTAQNTVETWGELTETHEDWGSLIDGNN